MRTHDEDMKPVDINIELSKICFIIIKAREFDAKVDPVEPDPGSNGADGGEREILEDYADDPTLEELRELIDLVALAWVGRGDFVRDDWTQARALARDSRGGPTTAYLIGMPALGDYLEEGLAELGYSCADVDAKHL
jgi:Protein of unknown function (DUF3775)